MIAPQERREESKFLTSARDFARNLVFSLLLLRVSVPPW